MPRDSDKNNESRGRRDRPGSGKGRAGGGKGRSGAARGPDKKFAKRGFAGKDFAGKGDGEKRPFKPRGDSDAPRRDFSDKPRFNRDDRGGEKRPYTPRGDRPKFGGDRDGEKRSFKPREDRGGEKRPYTPRGDRPKFDRGDRDGEKRSFKPREDRGGEKRPYTPRGDRDDARPAGRFSERKFSDKKPYTPRERDGEKRPYTPRGEGFRKDGDRPRGDRPYSPRPPRDGDRPERKFGGERKFSSRGAPDRGPRKDFGDRPQRGESKPWQKREGGSDRPERDSRPPRDGARNFDKPRFDKPRFDKPRDDRGGDERPRFSRSRDDRPRGDRPQGDRPKFDRPRRDGDTGRPEGRRDWQEHPRSESREDRPRRENEDDSKIFAKRPAFGGRGAYRERAPEFDKRAPRAEPKPKKSGERIAKVLARAGLASRRDAEEMVTQGRVTVNGRVINSPALDITGNDVVAVDGKNLPPRERTRLFM